LRISSKKAWRLKVKRRINMRVLGVIFYAGILIIIGLALIVFSVMFTFVKFQPEAVDYINNGLTFIQNSPTAKIAIGLSGIMIVLISVSFAQLILGRFHREKNIAFATPSGQVTIALSAIEDVLRRLSTAIPEIKDLRADVRALKKDTIIADLRAVLRSESNIPEATGRLQDMARSKIQEVLGIEGEIIVKVHIVKIDSREEREKIRKGIQEPAMPYSGYGKA
jgi:uncharacterized alkaline shock family protein YloU